VVAHPEARSKEGMDSLAKASLAQSAKEQRMARILAEAETRFNHELMPDNERQELFDWIKRLRHRLEVWVS
jgi:hypothetical protein